MQEKKKNNYIDDEQTNNKIKLSSDKKSISPTLHSIKSISLSNKSNEKSKVIDKITLKNNILSDFINASILFLTPKMKKRTIKRNSVKPIHFENFDYVKTHKKKSTNLTENINFNNSIKIENKEKDKQKINPFFESSLKKLEAEIQNKIKNIGLKVLNDGEEKTIINNLRERRDSCPLFSTEILGPHVTKQLRELKNNIPGNCTEKIKKIKTHEKYEKYITKINYKKRKNILKSERLYKKILGDRFRRLERAKMIYDSLDDDEDDSLIEGKFISPDSEFVFIFDSLLLIFTFYSVIFIPIDLAKTRCFCMEEKYIKIVPKLITEILFIMDLIICSFKGYMNNDFILIKNNYKIFNHYLSEDFLTDFIESIPFYIIITIICYIKRYNNDNENFICVEYSMSNKYIALLFLSTIKLLKLYKILIKKSNKVLDHLIENISENYYLEKAINFFLYILVTLLFLHLFSCYILFLGHQDYPNWIYATNMQNSSFTKQYITSLYYILTTMTTVGYGDIVCISLSEKIFQIILLAIGVVAYSFIVSMMGNYIQNQSHAQIELTKNENILEEIRITYPSMSYNLYLKIHKHLFTLSQNQHNYDTSILINTLPEKIKNHILITIYKKVIDNFKIFKLCNNSDFILSILTSFIPLISKKEDFLIVEGEIVENIVFIRDGKLSLVASINIDDPMESIRKYLDENFDGISSKEEILNLSSDLSNSNSKEKNYLIMKTLIHTIINKDWGSLLNEKPDNIGYSQIDISRKGIVKDKENYHYLKILDIRKNEHFGDVHIFLQKPAPLSLKVTSKKAELFLIRKNDAKMISKTYPNIWKKIYNRSYHNLVSVKRITFNLLKNYWVSGFNNNPKQKIKDNIVNELFNRKSYIDDIIEKISNCSGNSGKSIFSLQKLKNNIDKKNTFTKSSIFKNNCVEVIKEEDSSLTSIENVKRKESKSCLIYHNLETKEKNIISPKKRKNEKTQIIIPKSSKILSPPKMDDKIMNSKIIKTKRKSLSNKKPNSIIKMLEQKFKKKQSDSSIIDKNKQSLSKSIEKNNHTKISIEPITEIIDNISVSQKNEKLFNMDFLTISSNSFEINSSYKNFNKLTKGKIIKNENYKNEVYNFIKKLNLKKKNTHKTKSYKNRNRDKLQKHKDLQLSNNVTQLRNKLSKTSFVSIISNELKPKKNKEKIKDSTSNNDSSLMNLSKDEITSLVPVKAQKKGKNSIISLGINKNRNNIDNNPKKKISFNNINELSFSGIRFNKNKIENKNKSNNLLSVPLFSNKNYFRNIIVTSPHISPDEKNIKNINVKDSKCTKKENEDNNLSRGYKNHSIQMKMRSRNDGSTLPFYNKNTISTKNITYIYNDNGKKTREDLLGQRMCIIV